MEDKAAAAVEGREERVSGVLGDYFQAETLVRLVQKKHEGSDREFDTFNALTVALEKLEKVRDFLNAEFEAASN